MSQGSDRELPALPFTTALADGTTIFVRYLEPSDREELRRGFLKLSILSRWLRFASPMRRLTEVNLRYLTEVDQKDHVAVAVRDEGSPNKDGVAVARFVRLEDDPTAAEFAITVVDDYQDRGIGKLLVRVMFDEAARRGIRILRGFVLESNRKMLHILESFGARLKRRLDRTIEADLPVPPRRDEPGRVPD
jgi:RimJ/RimL family protein N-acetyltransferase